VWEALQDVTLYALIASGFFSLLTGRFLNGGGEDSGTLEGIAILGSVAVVVLVTAVNDYQKESQFQELNAVKEDEQVRVIRSGREEGISIFDLVVGDLLIVEGGDIVPADVVLVGGGCLKADESHLTGESDEVLKEAQGDALVISGSKIAEGTAHGIVIAVGENSQSGIISMLTSQRKDGDAGKADDDGQGMRKGTVLMGKLDGMANSIGRLGLGAAVATTLLMSGSFSWETFVVNGSPWSWGYLHNFLEFLITGITVLVVAVPEGLPLAVTIALAFSVKRMLAEKNLVRQLGACETMGCATTILTDKTGTLTQNRMKTVRLWAAGEEHEIRPSGVSKWESGAFGKMSRFTFNEEVSCDFLDDLQGGGYEALGGGPPVGSWSPKHLPPRLRRELFLGIALNTTASYTPASGEEGAPQWAGSRTEGALLELAYWAGCDVAATRRTFSTTCLLPFSSKRKCMGSFAARRSDGGAQGTLYVKGAPDVLLGKCDGALGFDGSVVPLTAAQRQCLKRPFEDDGLRVLCLAMKPMEMPEFNASTSTMSMEEDSLLDGLTLIGLIGIEDPVRPEVPSAVAQCRRAGITVRMLTGDNASTGASIAAQAGILDPDMDRSTAVMQAQRFMDLVTRPDGTPDADKFQELWPRVRVLARCSPVHKHDIVKKLHAANVSANIGNKTSRREVLAMTGDGTNDAPALRAADVGFGMNSGTNIAKSASDIVIMDDSFSSLVSAVRWGRNVYISITKFLQFQLTINIVAVGITVLGAAVLQHAPLGAVQMLWVNLIMDSLASLSLATEPPSDALLELPPFSSEAPLVSGKVLKHIAGQASYQLAALVALLALGRPVLGLDMADDSQREVLFTLVFNSLVQMSLFNQVNCRRVRDEPNVLSGIMGNKFFLYIIGGEFLLQCLIVQYGGEVFKTAPLAPGHWALCLGLGAGSLAVHQALVRLPDPGNGAEGSA